MKIAKAVADVSLSRIFKTFVRTIFIESFCVGKDFSLWMAKGFFGSPTTKTGFISPDIGWFDLLQPSNEISFLPFKLLYLICLPLRQLYWGEVTFFQWQFLNWDLLYLLKRVKLGFNSSWYHLIFLEQCQIFVFCIIVYQHWNVSFTIYFYL